jgi:hypothetical protein
MRWINVSGTAGLLIKEMFSHTTAALISRSCTGTLLVGKQRQLNF